MLYLVDSARGLAAYQLIEDCPLSIGSAGLVAALDLAERIQPVAIVYTIGDDPSRALGPAEA